MSCVEKCRRLEADIRRLEMRLKLRERQVEEALSGLRQVLITGDLSLADLAIRIVNELLPSPDELRRQLVREARKWVGTKEVGGDNMGPEVEMFQRAVDGKAQGEPWCACFAIFCIKEVEARYDILSPVYRSEATRVIWDATPVSQRLSGPEIGSLAVWEKVGTRFGHIEIVTEPDAGNDKFLSVGGNTSDGSGVNRDGDGVYEKVRSIERMGRLRVMGFLRVF